MYATHDKQKMELKKMFLLINKQTSAAKKKKDKLRGPNRAFSSPFVFVRIGQKIILGLAFLIGYVHDRFFFLFFSLSLFSDQEKRERNK